MMSNVEKLKELQKRIETNPHKDSEDYEMLSILVSGPSEEDVLNFRGTLYQKMLQKYKM